MNPYYHSKSSVKKWKGKIEDYLPIHTLLDDPKTCMNNHTNRFATHNIWFCYKIIPMIFGYTITNSDGKEVDTTDVALLHVAEDFRFKFIPTLEDYLKHMEVQDWMKNANKTIQSQESIDNIKLLKK